MCYFVIMELLLLLTLASIKGEQIFDKQKENFELCVEIFVCDFKSNISVKIENEFQVY